MGGQMKNFRAPTWLPLAGLVMAMGVVLGGLLLVVANDREGMVDLAGDGTGVGARAEAQVEHMLDDAGGYSFADVLAKPGAAWER